jgi:hypothetical protein
LQNLVVGVLIREVADSAYHSATAAGPEALEAQQVQGQSPLALLLLLDCRTWAAHRQGQQAPRVDGRQLLGER